MKAFTLSLFLLLGALAYGGESVLYSFQGQPDGTFPYAGVVADANGNLYGTTQMGGTGPCSYVGFPGCGTVFELSPKGNGGWKESVIYNFTGGADGQGPVVGLIVDGQGNLYGETGLGINCPPNCGSVFELSPGGNGWTIKLLHSFKGGRDGKYADGAVVMDSVGNLYGTTSLGGPKGYGTVFELSNSGNGWKFKTLHAFDSGAGGGRPEGSIVLASDGTIYGTTAYGGNPNDYGVFYSLTPNGMGKWKERVLYSFQGGTDGGNPPYGLVADPQGNLYGVSPRPQPAWGVVFQFSQNAKGAWKKKTIYRFHGIKHGFDPTGPVMLDPSGNVYGLSYGGSKNRGALYELTPPQSGNLWSETLIYSFRAGADGSTPSGQLWRDANGNLYGTTLQGGNGIGTVFEVTP